MNTAHMGRNMVGRERPNCELFDGRFEYSVVGLTVFVQTRQVSAA